MFHHQGQWHLFSENSPDASEIPIRTFDPPAPTTKPVEQTTSELFWDLFRSQGFVEPLDTSLCLSFDLSIPSCAKVRSTESPCMRLVSAHSLDDLSQLDISELAQYNPAAELDLATVDECNTFLKSQNALQRPGIIALDKNFTAIRLENPSYTALRALYENSMQVNYRTKLLYPLLRVESNVDLRARLALLELHRFRQPVEECLLEMPQFASKSEEVGADVLEVARRIDACCAQLVETNSDMKQFAAAARKHKFYGILFQMNSTKTNALSNLPMYQPRQLLPWFAELMPESRFATMKFVS